MRKISALGWVIIIFVLAEQVLSLRAKTCALFYFVSALWKYGLSSLLIVAGALIIKIVETFECISGNLQNKFFLLLEIPCETVTSLYPKILIFIKTIRNMLTNNWPEIITRELYSLGNMFRFSKQSYLFIIVKELLKLDGKICDFLWMFSRPGTLI